MPGGSRRHRHARHDDSDDAGAPLAGRPRAPRGPDLAGRGHRRPGAADRAAVQDGRLSTRSAPPERRPAADPGGRGRGRTGRADPDRGARRRDARGLQPLAAAVHRPRRVAAHSAGRADVDRDPQRSAARGAARLSGSTRGPARREPRAVADPARRGAPGSDRGGVWPRARVGVRRLSPGRGRRARGRRALGRRQGDDVHAANQVRREPERHRRGHVRAPPARRRDRGHTAHPGPPERGEAPGLSRLPRRAHQGRRARDRRAVDPYPAARRLLEGRREDRDRVRVAGRNRPGKRAALPRGPGGRRRGVAGSGGAPAGPEDGRDRPSRRRRGPRLQQPPDDHPWSLRNPPEALRAGYEAAPGPRSDPADGASSRRAHQAAPGVQPTAGAPAARPASQRRGRRVGLDASAPDRRAHHPDDRPERSARPGQGRPDPARADTHEPRDQRARRDAARRAAHDRDGRRRSRRDLRA